MDCRKNNPKQLLNIVGKTTMLQMTVDRFQKMKNVEDIFIVTSKDLAPKIKKMINGIKSENIIIEPSGKNTAPAIGLAALRIKSIRKDAVMGVFPADHLVIGAQKFSHSTYIIFSTRRPKSSTSTTSHYHTVHIIIIFLLLLQCQYLYPNLIGY
ncbi:sugar phosphate nucleotidyltransferase [Candidatus Marinimicrobia bacterium]|nr:sugar phosphate nucleotidyltransferase [Candidatus Neomarinimicrobiota bacterium]